MAFQPAVLELRTVGVTNTVDRAFPGAPFVLQAHHTGGALQPDAGRRFDVHDLPCLATYSGIGCVDSHEPLEDSVETTIDDLLWGTSPELVKGDAIIAYAQVLTEIQDLMYSPANDAIIRDKIDAVLAIVDAAADVLAGDPDLIEIDGLLQAYRNKFE